MVVEVELKSVRTVGNGLLGSNGGSCLYWLNFLADFLCYANTLLQLTATL